jgi:DNA-binding response OmpR family regulator
MIDVNQILQPPITISVPGILALAGHRILVATDGLDVTEIASVLADAGYETVCTTSASMHQGSEIDLVVLVSQDATSVVNTLHTTLVGGLAPVIVVCRDSAPSSASHCILQGADDYLVYPFSGCEFLARVYRTLRRHQRGAPHWTRGCEGSSFIQLRSRDCIIVLNGTPIRLTEAQFGIIARLVAAQGEWVRSSVLQKEVLRANAAVGASNVRFHILRVRKALRKWAVCLHGKQRLGYMWSPDTCDAPHCLCRKGNPAQDRDVLIEPSS